MSLRLCDLHKMSSGLPGRHGHAPYRGFDTAGSLNTPLVYCVHYIISQNVSAAEECRPAVVKQDHVHISGSKHIPVTTSPSLTL